MFKLVWGAVASLGLFICIAGFMQLTQVVAYFIGDKPAAAAPSLIGIGICIFAFARTWMLITWRRPRRLTGHKAHEAAIPAPHPTT